MAGDWIKMRVDLTTDPAVIAVSAETGLDEYAVVGRLHHLWSWADKHTENGVANGVSEAWIDRFLYAQGFAKALESAGWLRLSEAGVSLPRFGRHMSQSAKRRALDAKRKVRKRSAKGPHEKRTKSGPEKRREEKKETEGTRKIEFTGNKFIVDPEHLTSLVAEFENIDVPSEIAALGVWASETGKTEFKPSPYAFVYRNLNRKNQEAAAKLPPKRNSPGPDLSRYLTDDMPRIGT